MFATTTATFRIGGIPTIDAEATIQMRQRLVATAFGGFRPWIGSDATTNGFDIDGAGLNDVRLGLDNSSLGLDTDGLGPDIDCHGLDIERFGVDATSDRHLHRPSATGYGHRP